MPKAEVHKAKVHSCVDCIMILGKEASGSLKSESFDYAQDRSRNPKQIQITQFKCSKSSSGLTDDAFSRVAADTKTCVSPLNLAPP